MIRLIISIITDKLLVSSKSFPNCNQDNEAFGSTSWSVRALWNLLWNSLLLLILACISLLFINKMLLFQPVLLWIYHYFFAVVTTQCSTLNSTTQHVISLNCAVRVEWSELTCNTIFPLPTLLQAGYSVRHKNVLNILFSIFTKLSNKNIWRRTY